MVIVEKYRLNNVMMVILLMQMDDHLFAKSKTDGPENKAQAEEQTSARRSAGTARTWATNSEMIRMYTSEMAATIFASSKMAWLDMEAMPHIMTSAPRIEVTEEISAFFPETMEI